MHQEIEGVHQEIQDEINVISNDIGLIKEMPVGSIVSWVLKPQSESGHEQSLPEGWVRCDGGMGWKPYAEP